MYPILLTLGENIDKVFSSFDLWVFHFFGSMQCTFLTYVAKFFTTFGDEGFIIPLVVVGAVLCLFKRTRKFGLSLIFAVVIGTLVTNIVVKPMALRVRPCGICACVLIRTGISVGMRTAHIAEIEKA